MSLLSLPLFLSVALSGAAGPSLPGPAIGERVTTFQAPDQDGRLRSFEDLRGPEGLVLVFFRTADW